MTDYEKKVRIALILRDKKTGWLVDEVRETTGMYFDASYLRKVFHGVNRSAKILRAIDEVLNLNDAAALLEACEAVLRSNNGSRTRGMVCKPKRKETR